MATEVIAAVRWKLISAMLGCFFSFLSFRIIFIYILLLLFVGSLNTDKFAMLRNEKWVWHKLPSTFYKRCWDMMMTLIVYVFSHIFFQLFILFYFPSDNLSSFLSTYFIGMKGWVVSDMVDCQLWLRIFRYADWSCWNFEWVVRRV